MSDFEREVRRTRVRFVRRAPRHSHGRSVRGRLFRGAALTVVFLLAFAGSAVALTYHRFQTNIDQHDISDLLGDDRPTLPEPNGPEDTAAGRALNILVLGSDTRAGENDVDGSGASGVTEGMRSDTAMLMHISADRSHVDVVSIPRDTLVDIPSCTLPDGTQTDPQPDAMFNNAFATGGQTGDVGAAAACTIRTVESMTGVLIDDFVVVDFVGFMSVVDALGGIPMYIPEDIDDPNSGLQLAAGCRLLDGQQALGLARARKTLGDGSDISRIGRQQDIVMAIVQEALRSRLLSDPLKLYGVLDISLQTLTTGSYVGSLPNALGLAASLASISSENITLVTMPFDPAGNRVVPSETYAPQVWERLRTDQALDPLVSGPGYEIVAAVPADPAPAAPAPADPSPAEEAPVAPGSTATPAPSPTEEPAPATVEEPAPEVDPALSCTKENAT